MMVVFGRSLSYVFYTLIQVEKVDGSPIYVAKSYMKARPPWASPTEHLDIRTSSSKKSKLFEEGTPFHAGDEFVPSSRVCK